jgi:hypothetical protein
MLQQSFSRLLRLIYQKLSYKGFIPTFHFVNPTPSDYLQQMLTIRLGGLWPGIKRVSGGLLFVVARALGKGE